MHIFIMILSTVNNWFFRDLIESKISVANSHPDMTGSFPVGSDKSGSLFHYSSFLKLSDTKPGKGHGFVKLITLISFQLFQNSCPFDVGNHLAETDLQKWEQKCRKECRRSAC
jgi:hypothetical protein